MKLSRFRLVDQEDFLGDSALPSMQYEWTLPPQFGDFSIRFISPTGESPRRFYAGPIVRRVLGAKTDFLETACDHGARILARYDLRDAAETLGLHQTFAPLFRNRAVGHFANQHRFGAAVDFGVVDNVHRPDLIAPGLLADDSIEFESGTSIKGIVNRLLHHAIPKSQGRTLTSRDVIQHYQELLAFAKWVHLETFPSIARLETLPLARTALDGVFIEGVDVHAHSGPNDERPISAMVSPSHLLIGMFRAAKALIHGADLGEDGTEATHHQARFEHLLSRFYTAAWEKDPPAFDRWLKNESGQGFVRLLPGGRNLPPDEREAMRRWARQVFRLILWISYLWMARCYGALMLLAWLGFCDDVGLQTTPAEQRLFRQMHLPQVYLGGIPLAFLEPWQLRWIMSPLHDLWNQGVFDVEAYAPIAELLGIYGVLAENRREADRRTKQIREADRLAKEKYSEEGVRANPLGDFDRGQEWAFPDLDDEPPLLLASPSCDCGCPLQPGRIKDTSHDLWVTLDVYCPRCDVTFSRRISRTGSL